MSDPRWKMFWALFLIYATVGITMILLAHHGK